MGGDPPPAQSKAIKAAQQASLIFDDPRVQQFFDPNQRVGKAVAQGLLNANIAWDIYLFYNKGIEWSHPPPKPARWMHRLPPDQADRAHQRSGDALLDELRSVMNSYGFAIQHDQIAANDALQAELEQLVKRVEDAQSKDPKNVEKQARKGFVCARCAKDPSASLCALVDEPRYRISTKSMAEAIALEEAHARGDVLAKTIDLRVNGMTCLGCMARVGKALLMLPGVDFVDVNYDEKSAQVTLGKGKDLSDQLMIDALEKVGCQATVMQIREPE